MDKFTNGAKWNFMKIDFKDFNFQRNWILWLGILGSEQEILDIIENFDLMISSEILLNEVD